MNSVDALGAKYNSESLDKVTKELTRVTSFITLSSDSRMTTLFIGAKTMKFETRECD